MILNPYRYAAVGGNTLLTGLVSYWKLDEASGDALDAHGTNTLTDTNTVGSAAGKIGNARDFELANAEYVTNGDSVSLSTGDIDFTFTGWINGETLTDNNFVISKDDTGSSREYGLYYETGGNRLNFYVFSGASGADPGTVVANNAGALSTATWYLVIVGHDSVNNLLSIQVFGAASSTANTVAHTTGVYDGHAAFEIGAQATWLNWDGLIDEVGFWKRILTSDERTALYNSGAGLAYTSFT